jgi:hypothetical protein
MDCHEIWHYDDARGIQKLVELVTLCSPCHRVKHFGLALSRGEHKEAFAHLAAVNGWPEKLAMLYVALCFAIWQRRSKRRWKLDLTWLSARGITVSPRSRPPVGGAA